MKVLIIGYTHPKFDKRVFRTVQALSRVAQVYYQYLTYKPEESINEGNIHYIPVYKIQYRRNIVRKYRSRRSLDKAIMNLVENSDYNLLYLHHFPATAPLAPFKNARKLGKVVIYDIHEYHPQNFLKFLPKPIEKIKEAVMWPVFKKQLLLSDGCIFVSEETAEDVFRILDIKRPTLVIPNYASKILKPGLESKRKEICYVGKVERSLTKKDAQILNALSKHGITFKTIGINAGEKVKNSISLPFLSYNDMLQEVAASMFSWISYQTTGDENYKNDLFALPNKFYDSLAAGTPVIVNERFVSMARIVKEKGVGVVINPQKVDESVQKILEAIDRYEEIFNNVMKHQNEFVWDEDKEKAFLEFVLGIYEKKRAALGDKT